MQNINYMGEGTQVLGGKDGIVIRKHIAGIEAGRALDCTDYPDEIIPAGLRWLAPMRLPPKSRPLCRTSCSSRRRPLTYLPPNQTIQP